VLTAISVTHEFLLLRKQHDGQERRLSDGLAALRSKLDAALENDALKR
jgi:cell division protein ZapA